MFLTTFSQGWKIFGNLSVILFTLAFLAWQVFYFSAIRWASSRSGMSDAASTGCLTQVLGVLLQALGLGVLLLVLLPVLLGLQSQVSWNSVEAYAMLALRAAVLAAVAMSLLSFLPVLGRWLAGSPGLEILLGGGILFRLLSHPYLKAKFGENLPASLYPGFWESLVYLALAFLIGRLVMLATFRFHAGSGKNPNAFLLRITGPTLDCLVGIAVLYLYTQYTAVVLAKG
ncbi:MAG TPA: hypothetical protein DF383_03095 [Deltaproteobacteria bacterium]|nr:hypothetical protein [Deltaproteobacteria bacterium]